MPTSSPWLTSGTTSSTPAAAEPLERGRVELEARERHRAARALEERDDRVVRRDLELLELGERARDRRARPVLGGRLLGAASPPHHACQARAHARCSITPPSRKRYGTGREPNPVASTIRRWSFASRCSAPRWPRWTGARSPSTPARRSRSSPTSRSRAARTAATRSPRCSGPTTTASAPARPCGARSRRSARRSATGG